MIWVELYDDADGSFIARAEMPAVPRIGEEVGVYGDVSEPGRLIDIGSRAYGPVTMVVWPAMDETARQPSSGPDLYIEVKPS